MSNPTTPTPPVTGIDDPRVWCEPCGGTGEGAPDHSTCQGCGRPISDAINQRVEFGRRLATFKDAALALSEAWTSEVETDGYAVSDYPTCLPSFDEFAVEVQAMALTITPEPTLAPAAERALAALTDDGWVNVEVTNLGGNNMACRVLFDGRYVLVTDATVSEPDAPDGAFVVGAYADATDDDGEEPLCPITIADSEASLVEAVNALAKEIA